MMRGCISKSGCSALNAKKGNQLTVFRSEQRTDNTTCLSGQLARYVMALTPLTGKTSVRINGLSYGMLDLLTC